MCSFHLCHYQILKIASYYPLIVFQFGIQMYKCYLTYAVLSEFSVLVTGLSMLLSNFSQIIDMLFSSIKVLLVRSSLILEILQHLYTTGLSSTKQDKQYLLFRLLKLLNRNKVPIRIVLKMCSKHFINVRCSNFCLFLKHTQLYFGLTHGSLLRDQSCWGLDNILGIRIKPGLTMCKSRALYAVLSLQSLDVSIFI